MNEKVWYLYQNGQQVGPFDSPQIAQLHSSNMIAKDSFVFKVGWKDWRTLEESMEALGLVPAVVTVAPPQKPTMLAQDNRQSGKPRATIQGRVVVHNNHQLSIGQGVNISSTGIFVETNQQIFTIGERLRLTVRCDGLNKSFNAEATVIRFSNEGRYPVGYGLKFEKIDPKDRERVQKLVDDANKRGDVGNLVAR